METQENKALANKVIQAIGAGDWTFVEEAFAEDAKVWVAGSMPISGDHGKAFVLASGGRTKAFFPEGMSLTPKALTAEGERVAVEAEQVRGADLVAAGGGERGREQRHLDLLEDAVIEAGRRHAVREALEVR